jgi:uncharacterized protein YciI
MKKTIKNKKMKQILPALFCLLSVHVFSQDSSKTAPKQFLGVLTLTEKYKDEKNWDQQAQAIVGDHFKRLLKSKADGILILAGRTEYQVTNPEMMGLVIFYAKDDAAALQFMMEDPAVKNNIMAVKVHPYSVAVNKCN